MKIVHLTASYCPNHGGVETHVSQINTQLIERGHTVFVLTQQKLNEKLFETIDSVHVTRIPRQYFNNKISTWAWIWSHLQILKQADVIHVHDVFWWLLPFYFVLNKPVYTTFHGWEGQYPVRFVAKLQRFIFSLLSKGTIHVGGYIQEFYWDKPDKIVYGAALTEGSKLRKNFHRPVQIIFIGRLVQENNIHQYLELLSSLQKLMDFQMTWVGDGPFRRKCQRFGQVTGMVDDVQVYLDNADVVFASSYLSIIESQQMGKLVCALYQHMLKKRYLETYPCTSHMIISGEPELAANQVAQYVSDRNMFSSAQETVRCAGHLTWEYVVDQYIQLWTARK